MANFKPSQRATLRLALSATTLAVLSACGGGSSNGDGASLAAKLRLTGVAASTLAPLVAQTVSAKCGAAVGSNVSGADGSYAIEIDNAALPCMLEVSTAGGATLHSVAVGTGTEAQANINPVTELIVASATAANPATAFQTFDATAAAAITAPVVQAATTTVTTTLASAGVDLSAAGNPLTTTSTASLATALQTLDTALTTSGTSLTTLTTTVAQTSPQATTPPPASASPLPAAQLLQPAAANCNALRSGTYRFVGLDPAPAGSQADSATFTLDAQALTIQFSGEAAEPLVPAGTCRYKDAGIDAAVSAAGVIAIRWLDDNGVGRAGIAFPEQTHAPAAMGGTWNLVSNDSGPSNAAQQVGAYSVSIAADGQSTTAASDCSALSSCTAFAAADLPALKFSANPAGGLILANTKPGDTWQDAFYVYKAGNGGMLGVDVSPSGTVALWTQARANGTPVVGTVSETWNLTVNNQNQVPGAISESKNTIVSVDAATKGFVRDSVINFTTGATRPETMGFNSPSDGFTYRSAGTVTASDGSTSGVSEFLALGLRGMGMSGVIVKANQSLILSVGKVAP